MNFAPDGEFTDKESRLQRVLHFMEQRHYMALARQHAERALAKKLTDANRFYIRLTNMFRVQDPTPGDQINGIENQRLRRTPPASSRRRRRR